ncbi:MAG: hypothetical protein QM778_35245 [Myxococcales bacterium]
MSAETLGLAKQRHRELKRESDTLAVRLVEIVEHCAVLSDACGALAAEIARAEPGSEEKQVWERIAQSDKAASKPEFTKAARALVGVISKALVTQRSDDVFVLAERLDSRRKREWLIRCAAIRRLHAVGMMSMGEQGLVDLLADVDDHARSLAVDAIAEALQDKRQTKRNDQKEASPDARLAASVGVLRFAARLAAMCGALGYGMRAYRGKEEETAYEAFKMLVREDPELGSQLS